MKIAVLGAGAMGSLVGAHLKKGGAEVILVDPYKEHMDVIRDKGLEMIINGESQIVKMDTVYSADSAGVVDLVICLVKGMYTRSALEGAKTLFGENTYIITLQNGIGNVDTLLDMFSKDKVMKGVMKITSQLLAPGQIKSNILNDVTAIHVGTANEDTVNFAKDLVKCFVDGGLKTEFHEDVDYYIWSKAVNNISINSACAVARLTIRDFLTHTAGRGMLEACLKEVIEIAEAKGIMLDYKAVIKSIDENTIPKFGGHLPSTAQDVKAKKATEIDFLNGAISRYGKELGIATPVNDMITAFIKIIEDNYDKMF